MVLANRERQPCRVLPGLAMNKKLLILGAGGHGKVVADAAERAGLWQQLAFLDDRYPEKQCHEAWPVFGQIADWEAFKDWELVVAIGHCETRLRISREIDAAGFPLATVVHPSAIVSPYVKIGAGSVVLARAVLNPGVQVGMATIINTGAIIEHDCFFDDGVHACPGVLLAGNVSVGECTWLGIGSVYKQGVRIDEHVMVGAGAVVVANVEAATTAIGFPARAR